MNVIFLNPQNMTIRGNYKFMETEYWRGTFAQGDIVRWFPTRGRLMDLFICSQILPTFV